jgi:hypothetical protein
MLFFLFFFLSLLWPTLRSTDQETIEFFPFNFIRRWKYSKDVFAMMYYNKETDHFKEILFRTSNQAQVICDYLQDIIIKKEQALRIQGRERRSFSLPWLTPKNEKREK